MNKCLGTKVRAYKKYNPLIVTEGRDVLPNDKPLMYLGLGECTPKVLMEPHQTMLLLYYYTILQVFFTVTTYTFHVENGLERKCKPSRASCIRSSCSSKKKSWKE